MIERPGKINGLYFKTVKKSSLIFFLASFSLCRQVRSKYTRTHCSVTFFLHPLWNCVEYSVDKYQNNLICLATLLFCVCVETVFWHRRKTLSFSKGNISLNEECLCMYQRFLSPAPVHTTTKMEIYFYNAPNTVIFYQNKAKKEFWMSKQFLNNEIEKKVLFYRCFAFLHR